MLEAALNGRISPSAQDRRSSDNFTSMQSPNYQKKTIDSQAERDKIEALKKEKNEKSARIARIKRQLAEIEIQEEELQREVSANFCFV